MKARTAIAQNEDDGEDEKKRDRESPLEIACLTCRREAFWLVDLIEDVDSLPDAHISLLV